MNCTLDSPIVTKGNSSLGQFQLIATKEMIDLKISSLGYLNEVGNLDS